MHHEISTSGAVGSRACQIRRPPRSPPVEFPEIPRPWSHRRSTFSNSSTSEAIGSRAGGISRPLRTVSSRAFRISRPLPPSGVEIFEFLAGDGGRRRGWRGDCNLRGCQQSKGPGGLATSGIQRSSLRGELNALGVQRSSFLNSSTSEAASSRRNSFDQCSSAAAAGRSRGRRAAMGHISVP